MSGGGGLVRPAWADDERWAWMQARHAVGLAQEAEQRIESAGIGRAMAAGEPLSVEQRRTVLWLAGECADAAVEMAVQFEGYSKHDAAVRWHAEAVRELRVALGLDGDAGEGER